MNVTLALTIATPMLRALMPREASHAAATLVLGVTECCAPLLPPIRHLQAHLLRPLQNPPGNLQEHRRLCHHQARRMLLQAQLPNSLRIEAPLKALAIPTKGPNSTNKVLLLTRTLASP